MRVEGGMVCRSQEEMERTERGDGADMLEARGVLDPRIDVAEATRHLLSPPLVAGRCPSGISRSR